MRSLLLAFFFLATYFQICPSSAQPPQTVATNIVGHYYLSGMREVGSELVLRPTGEFEWALMYGAVDLYARGTWKLDGAKVILMPAQPSKGEFRLFKESELKLRKNPKAGVWVAIVGVPHSGPVKNIEVQFVSSSGKKARAVSGENGDAVVTMPASERWTRTGLRRAGTDDQWQWVNVPSVRAAARVAAFAVTNWQEIGEPPFKKLELRMEKGALTIDDDASNLEGVYTKNGEAIDTAALLHCSFSPTSTLSSIPDPTCISPSFPAFGRFPPSLISISPLPA